MNENESKPTERIIGGISKSAVELALSNNRTWTSLPPVAPIADPVEEARVLAEVAKFWKGEKACLVNTIVADLRRCEENMSRYGQEYGHDYRVKVWSIVERQLAVTIHWHGKAGPMATWKAVYRKASLKAQQDLPKPVAMALDDRMERLKKAQLELARARAV